METRRLHLLAELARHGSMRAVADELGVTTSTVSQQLAALAREAGTELIEPVGRNVRLTTAGRRLAEHATTILAAVEAARLDLDPAAEPAGTVRVAGFATAIRRSLLPVVADLAESHPAVRLLLREHEPAEALVMLDDGEVDLALVYDYNLAPRPYHLSVAVTPLWAAPWSLAVPGPARATTIAAWRDSDWIVNSRNTADEEVVLTLASMAGFEPRIAHRADGLDLVQDLILTGLGVALLPADLPPRPGIHLAPLTSPAVVLRCYAVTRLGRGAWAPLRLLLRKLTSAPTRESARSRARVDDFR
jgi:DNA-binding transcriptional LysR family regulator